MAKSKRRQPPNIGGEKVGYRKPPKQTQWRKGQSGNPRGRQRGSHNFKTDLIALLKSTVCVVRDGEPAQMSTQQAVLVRLCEKALKGDIRALVEVIHLMREHSDAEPPNIENLSANDREILEIYNQRILSGAAHPLHPAAESQTSTTTSQATESTVEAHSPSNDQRQNQSQSKEKGNGNNQNE